MNNKTIIFSITLGILLIAGAYAGYAYLNNDNNISNLSTETIKEDAIQEELTKIKTTIDNLEDFDLTELDNISKELELIDLSGL